MNIIELQQGSMEWIEYRRAHFTASEAPAVLGLSKYKTRSELLREKATGITPDIDSATQRRFDSGHEAEAATRAIAEQLVGEELFPATGTETVDGLPLLASFDGITMLETVLWENKLWNEGFAAQVRTGEVPDTHWPQLEHQMLVSGVERVLFTVSDGANNVVHTWYSSLPERRARLIAAWKQFAIDLKDYQHVEHAEKPKAEAIMDLPALSVQATGMVTYSNLPEFKAAAESYIANINTDLQTDQHFADAEATVKFCKTTEEKLEVTKSAILAQTASIDEVIRTVDHIQAQLRDKRLMLDRLVKSEKEARKLAILNKAREDFNAHFIALEAEIKPIRLIAQHPDFGGAMKGLKKLSAMQEAVDTALRDGKFAAEQVAKDVRAKLAWCKEHAAGISFLFPDLQQIITKPMEDFALTITSRIKAHNEAEERKEAEIRAKAEADAAAKLEAERTRIQAEEEAKARAKVAAEAGVKADDAEAAYTEAARQVATYGTAAIRVTPELIKVVDTAEIRQIKPSRPSDKELIEFIAQNFGITYGQACDWIIETAERMKVAA